MTIALFRAFDRLETYTARARHSVEVEDYAMALAEVAEAAEIARRLWLDLEKANKEHQNE